mgnify:CR=1 FL=1
MYQRSNVYPNGQPIPESLPESYQPASYSNVPKGQSCFTCKNFSMATRYCTAWNAPVKPRWWCDGWTPIAMLAPSKATGVLLKKITTNTVEEHFSKSADPAMIPNRYSAIDNEEDVIKLNIPLMIRLLEFAREDASKDVDLHVIVENLIDLSEEGDVLEMEDYEEIVQNLKND